MFQDPCLSKRHPPPDILLKEICNLSGVDKSLLFFERIGRLITFLSFIGLAGTFFQENKDKPVDVRIILILVLGAIHRHYLLKNKVFYSAATSYISSE